MFLFNTKNYTNHPRVALYDNRIGTIFDGVTGAYEQYFDLIKPDEFTNELQNHPIYNPEDLHPEVIELISTYEDLIGIQIELLGLKGVTKGQPKHLKTHLLGEQKHLMNK